MTDEPVISRDEVLTIMWLIGDIALAARLFAELVGGDDGGEEAPDED